MVKMKELRRELKEVYEGHRTLFTLMVALLVLALALFIYTLVSLRPNASVVKVSYGDIGRYQGGEWSSMSNSGGYHDGSWQSRLVYLVFALILGIFHNVIALRIFRKKGEAYARVFVAGSIILVLLVSLVLWRLLGEG